MKTYLLRIYDSTVHIGLMLSFIVLILLLKFVFSSYADNMPSLFILFVIGFFMYISYKLSDGVISITLTVDDVIIIKNVEEPIVGSFEEKYIRLSDIESYTYTFSRGSNFLILYLYNTKKITFEIGGFSIKPDKDHFFSEFPNIISRFNETNHTNIYERGDVIQKFFRFIKSSINS